MPALVTLVAGLAVAAPAAQIRPGNTAPLEAGTMLVAARRLGDPNFAETVVLLFAYSAKNGAAGVIVNRKTDVPVQRVLPDLPVTTGPQVTAFIGGPVSRTDVRGLQRARPPGDGAVRVLPDVVLLTSRDALDLAIEQGATGQDLRLYFGYAGWSPGQLEREIQRGDWHLMKGDSAMVFSTEPDGVWRRLIRLTDVLAA